MLRHSILLLFAVFTCTFCFSQEPYFQQRVEYKMKVELNDERHSLSAFEEIKYVNNSPGPLGFIYFHLWPNAYKNNSTALAKQLLWEGKTDLFFSKPEDRGYIDSLDFRVNGKPLNWEYDQEHIDICKVYLDQPLKPGDSLVITTPFFLKIPDARFSRLGHTYQAYYMTQWYPKPAVFDNTGWHPMPYLDQGEFFSEYGSFDVKITLPDNYLLCATGDRIDAQEEEEFLERKIKDTQREIERRKTEKEGSSDIPFPVSSKLFKTIHFRQSNVHDFAWFADKRFLVLKGDVELPHSKRHVAAWIYFTPQNLEHWKDALGYVQGSTLFYSSHNGDYPYNHVTAVDGSIMAGGGMEYPNITVIGNVSSAIELDMVITHEVGHNWFYGILGSNERDQPFLDEGINSFYEMRYLRAKYPAEKLTSFADKDSSFRLVGLNRIPFWKYQEIPFYMASRMRSDQAMFLKAADYTESNYGAIVYAKSALVFDYLMDYLGEQVLDSAMSNYFREFRFKHPTADDLFRTLSTSSGKNLEAFRKHLVYSTDKIDYKIKKVKRTEQGYRLTLKNRTGTALPFNIYSYDKNNGITGISWFEGFEKKQVITLNVDAARFKIDGLDRMPDLNRKNNSIRTHGLFRYARPLRLSFLTRFEDPSRTSINFIPFAGANYYNSVMPGLAFHNYGFYEKRFEYLVAPMYAFNTRSAAGFAECNLNLYPKKIFSHISIGAKAKTFAYDYYDTKFMNDNLGTGFKDLYLNYYKIAPYIQLDLKKRKATSLIAQTLRYTNNNLFTDSLDARAYPSFAVSGPRKSSTYTFVNQLSYHLANKRSIDPFDLQMNLQHTAEMAKLSATLDYQVTVGPKHSVEIRLFAGAFLAGSAAERSYYAFRASGYNGWNDYLFEGNYLARNERNGLGFSQFMERDGALKVWTPLGQSAEWLTALNVKSPKIFRIPVKVFADVVACDGRSLNKDILLWDAGLNLVLWRDIIDIYVPLVYNSDIKRTLELNNVKFPNTIRFTFNIHKLAVKTILQNSFF